MSRSFVTHGARDPFAVNRWRAEQLRAARQAAGQLRPDELARAISEVHAANRWRRVGQDRARYAIYRERVDRRIKARDERQAAAAAERLKIREINRQIEEAQEAHLMRGAEEGLAFMRQQATEEAVRANARALQIFDAEQAYRRDQEELARNGYTDAPPRADPRYTAHRQ